MFSDFIESMSSLLPVLSRKVWHKNIAFSMLLFLVFCWFRAQHLIAVYNTSLLSSMAPSFYKCLFCDFFGKLGLLSFLQVISMNFLQMSFLWFFFGKLGPLSFLQAISMNFLQMSVWEDFFGKLGPLSSFPSYLRSKRFSTQGWQLGECIWNLHQKVKRQEIKIIV